MQRFKKIIPLFVSFAILVSCFGFSSYADYTNKDTFWNWLAGKGGFIQDIVGLASGSACGSSDDGHHHADSYVIDSNDGRYGCVCKYCGDRFIAHASDLSTAYDKHTENVQTTLGTTVLDSDGYLYWRPALLSAQIILVAYTGDNQNYYFQSSSKLDSDGFNMSMGFDSPNFTFSGTCLAGGGFRCYPRIYLNLSDVYPVTGYYCSPSGVSSFVSGLDSSATSISWSTTSVYPDNPTFSYHVAGESYSGNFSARPSGYAYVSYLSGVALVPAFKVKPLSGLVNVTTGDWSVDSRVGSIVGDYGIIGDNGTIIKSDSQYIINETNNSIYNPVTGDTTTITNWTYDYSDRSYTCITDSGNTTTITYGDEYVTINEGDTIYNIYYVVDGSETSHTHDYTSVVTTAPACTVPGLRTYTCSICGNTYTEQIAAVGHSWAVKESVTTQYDENGELLVQGYTIYKCSVCGEEYKSTDGTSPPDGGGGSGGGDSDGLFSGIFGILWDFCSFFFGFFTDFVSGGIKGFLGALLDGASGFFDILNPVGWFT